MDIIIFYAAAWEPMRLFIGKITCAIHVLMYVCYPWPSRFLCHIVILCNEPIVFFETLYRPFKLCFPNVITESHVLMIDSIQRVDPSPSLAPVYDKHKAIAGLIWASRRHVSLSAGICIILSCLSAPGFPTPPLCLSLLYGLKLFAGVYLQRELR